MKNIKTTVSGIAVEIVSVNGGWSEVKFQDGSTRKVRNSQIEKTEEVTMNAVNEAVVESVKAKRVALVGAGVLAGRTTKIKDVEVDLGRYEVAQEVTQSGRHVIDNGDDVARKLRSATLDEVYAMAARELVVDCSDETVDVIERNLRAQYQHLNPGMQRMNLGNRIRGAAAARAKIHERILKQQQAERVRNEREAAKVAKAAEKEAARIEREAAKAVAKADKEAAKADKEAAKAE